MSGAPGTCGSQVPNLPDEVKELAVQFVLELNRNGQADPAAYLARCPEEFRGQLLEDLNTARVLVTHHRNKK